MTGPQGPRCPERERNGRAWHSRGVSEKPRWSGFPPAELSQLSVSEATQPSSLGLRAGIGKSSNSTRLTICKLLCRAGGCCRGAWRTLVGDGRHERIRLPVFPKAPTFALIISIAMFISNSLSCGLIFIIFSFLFSSVYFINHLIWKFGFFLLGCSFFFSPILFKPTLALKPQIAISGSAELHSFF